MEGTWEAKRLLLSWKLHAQHGKPCGFCEKQEVYVYTICKHTAGLQMAKTWAHGKPKGFWQQAFFFACWMLASGNGETIFWSTSLADANPGYRFGQWILLYGPSCRSVCPSSIGIPFG